MRFGRSGAVLPWLLGITLVSTLMLQHKAKMTPPQRLSALRMQIVQTARDVESAYQYQMLTPEEYERAKGDVLRAKDTYNLVVKQFEQNNVFTTRQRDQVLALLNSALGILKASPKGGPR